MSPASIGRVAAMLRFIGSVSNLPLLTIGDYYYHSHNKMVKEKWRPDRDMVRVLVGVRGCVPRPMGHSLVTLFSLSVSVKDRPLHWILVKSQTYYPEHILAYGSGKARCSLIVGSGSFRTDWLKTGMVAGIQQGASVTLAAMQLRTGERS